MSQPQPWEVLGEEHSVAPSGFLPIVTRRYRMADGRERSWDLVGSPRTVAVLALTTDLNVVLARQYRPGPDLVLDELPGGIVEDGEDVLAAAGRELVEETGYVAARLELIGSTWLSARSPTRRSVAVASGCARVEEPFGDGDEECVPVLMSLTEFRAHLRSGALTDTDLGYLALDAAGLLTGGAE
jgi:ADP-ribose pyrophosphatase